MDILTLVKQVGLAVLARRKKWILLTTAVALLALVPGAYLLSKEPPRYRTQATILIENRPDKLPLFQEFSPYRPLPVQLAILNSRSLAESVVETLPRTSVDDLISNPYHRDYIAEAQNWYRRMRGEEPVVESPQRRALDELRRARVRFVPVGTTGIIQVAAEASRPRVSMDIANTYIEVLISRTRSFNVDDSKTTREYLEQQHTQITQSLGQSEDTLRQFNLARGGVKVPARSASTVSRISQLEQSLAEVQANRNMSQSRLQAMKQKLAAMPAPPPAEPKAPAAPAAAPPSNRLQRLRSKLTTLEGQLLEYESRYTEQHPRVTLTKQQIEEVKEELGGALREANPISATAAAARDLPAQDRMAFAETVSALEASAVSLSAQEDAIRRQLEQLRGDLTGLSKDELEFARLSTDVDSQRRLRAVLADKLSAARIREQGEMKVVKVIDPPSVPVAGTNQKRMKFLGFAMAMAFGIGIGLPALVEYFNRPVETEHDVRQLTGIPVLATVPLVRSRRSAFVAGSGLDENRNQDAFLFAEAFRRLRVEIQLLGREAELRCVLVASALPGEGKSTVVVNLGHAFGEIGKHVILADADFHRPTLHRTLKTPGAKGFSDLLAGTTELAEAMSPVGEGVWLMPRGASPTALTRTGLGSGRLGDLLDRLGSEAEYVIFDSSPILLIPDNLYMAAAADGVLLVVQAGVTRPRDLLRTKEILEKSGTPIIGVVLNQVPLNRINQYYSYYKAYARPEARA
jgi:succinoglycan biosynthesis transport protein ExoP